MAVYQQAELHRLRGQFAKAEEAYGRASQCRHTPQPGLAQLRLAQGRVDAAAAPIRNAADEAHDRLSRAKVLAAHVEIVLAAGDVDAREPPPMCCHRSPPSSTRRCCTLSPRMHMERCCSAQVGRTGRGRIRPRRPAPGAGHAR
jgi:hypothetical protein